MSEQTSLTAIQAAALQAFHKKTAEGQIDLRSVEITAIGAAAIAALEVYLQAIKEGRPLSNVLVQQGFAGTFAHTFWQKCPAPELYRPEVTAIGEAIAAAFEERLKYADLQGLCPQDQPKEKEATQSLRKKPPSEKESSENDPKRLLWEGNPFLDWTMRFEITIHKLVVKTGRIPWFSLKRRASRPLLLLDSLTIDLADVTGVDVLRRNLIQTILDYGSILVSYHSPTKEKETLQYILRWVKKPEEVKDLIFELQRGEEIQRLSGVLRDTVD